LQIYLLFSFRNQNSRNALKIALPPTLVTRVYVNVEWIRRQNS